MINHYTILYDFSWPQKYQVPTILTSTKVLNAKKINEYGEKLGILTTSNVYGPCSLNIIRSIDIS